MPLPPFDSEIATASGGQATAPGAAPWLRNPVDAHAAWLRTRDWTGVKTKKSGSYAPHSVAQYESCWRGFCKNLATKRLRLDQVKAPDIDAFLDQLPGRKPGQPASVRTRRTYLAEINRVFAHLVHEGLFSLNPATTVLTHHQRHHVIKNEPAVAPPGFLAAYERAADELYREELERAPRSWEPARNLALRLVASQCGLTLKEICKLIPANVRPRPDGNVEIQPPGHRLVQPRTLLATSRLAQALEGWNAKRAGLTIRKAADERLAGAAAASDPAARTTSRAPVRLFLASVEGRAQRSDAPLIAARTVARSPISEYLAESIITACVKRTMANTGRQAHINGPRYVRTAFAAQLLYDGIPAEEVGQRMGLRTQFTVSGIKAKMGALPHKAVASSAGPST